MSNTKPIVLVHCKQTQKKNLERMFQSKGVSLCESSPRVDFRDCGGCPGKELINQIQNGLDQGAEQIWLDSCITGEEGQRYCCTHFNQLKSEIESRFGDRISCVLSTRKPVATT